MAVVAAFFLPWLRIGALAGPSGWAIASDREFYDTSSRGLWLVPLCGLVMMSSLALGRLARPVNACAGLAITLVTTWIVARPLIPLEGGLTVALLSGAMVLVGELIDSRILRVIGAAGLSGAFLLDWFGRTGYANTQPAPCPHTRVTVIPWGVVVAGAVALASAIAPQRARRTLVRVACVITLLTVLAYVVVAYDPLTMALWVTLAAGVLALLVALISPTATARRS